MEELLQAPLVEKQTQEKPDEEKKEQEEATEQKPKESFMKATMKGLTEAGMTLAVATVTDITTSIHRIPLFQEEEDKEKKEDQAKKQKNSSEGDKITRQTRQLMQPLVLEMRQNQHMLQNNLQQIRSELRLLSQEKDASTEPNKIREEIEAQIAA